MKLQRHNGMCCLCGSMSKAGTSGTFSASLIPCLEMASATLQERDKELVHSLPSLENHLIVACAVLQLQLISSTSLSIDIVTDQ